MRSSDLVRPTRGAQLGTQIKSLIIEVETKNKKNHTRSKY